MNDSLKFILQLSPQNLNSFVYYGKCPGIHKMLVGIANREDPDQTASSEAV